jgi:hypothetical protein
MKILQKCVIQCSIYSALLPVDTEPFHRILNINEFLVVILERLLDMLVDELEAGGEAFARLVPAGGQPRAGGGEDDLVDVLRQLAAEDGGPATGEPLHQLAAEVLVPAHWRHTQGRLVSQRLRNGSRTVEIRTFTAFKEH